MNYAGHVRSFQCICALHSNFEKSLKVERIANGFPKRVSVDVLDNEEHLAIDFQDVVERGDLRMHQARSALCFLEEALTILLIRAQASAHSLERDCTLQL